MKRSDTESGADDKSLAKRTGSIAAPLDRLQRVRGRLPTNFTFDRDEANERHRS
jgi:hypothetical protein